MGKRKKFHDEPHCKCVENPEGYGIIYATGINLDRNFLNKVYAQFKKEIAHKSDIGIDATFIYIEVGGYRTLKCEFMENHAYHKPNLVAKTIHNDKFKKYLKPWMAKFERLLEDMNFRFNEGWTEDEIFEFYFPEAYKRQKEEAEQSA